MNGVVDDVGRALVSVSIRSDMDAAPMQIQAWIDTAFNGELVMPRSLIQTIGLTQSAAVEAILADGNPVMLESFSCVLAWFGEDRAVEVVANDGEFPLLGVGILLGHKLTVDYVSRIVSIH